MRRLGVLRPAVSWPAAALATTLLVVSTAGSASAASSCQTASGRVSCVYADAGVDSFTVPAGVSALDVVAVGAAGAGTGGADGASVEDASVPVTAGTLQVVVNSGGGSGVDGGGAGGGLSGLFGPGALSQASALVIAAGGGGGGVSGGAAVNPGGAGDIGAGGGDGGPTTGCGDLSNSGGCAGSGATGSAGGAGGADCAGPGAGTGDPGSALTGGGGSIQGGSGGGGAGYSGGGGGGGCYNSGPSGGVGGGGGGGSSFGVTGLSNQVASSASASVTITYTQPAQPPAKAIPSIAIAPSASSVVVGQPVSAAATVNGAGALTGTVSFELFAGDSCSGAPEYTSSGSALSAGAANSPSFTTTTAGVFHWIAAYSGDAGNEPAATACSAGTVTVAKASPSIALTASALSVRVGQRISATVSISGGSNPTGTVAFALFGNSSCSGTPAFIAASQPLSASTASAGPFTTASAGAFHWLASYSGDADNNPAATRCSTDSIAVTQTSPRISAAIRAARHRATFRFTATGAMRFQCGLSRWSSGKHRRQPSYRPCQSPKTFLRLEPGRYVFSVRVGGGVAPGPAATRVFTIR